MKHPESQKTASLLWSYARQEKYGCIVCQQDWSNWYCYGSDSIEDFDMEQRRSFREKTWRYSRYVNGVLKY